MAIRKIRATNFKNFRELEIELGKFNVLVGANASGKSNFIQIFKFLRDIAKSGLDNAISMQGGVRYLRNINIGSSENLSITVVSDQEVGLFGGETKKGEIVGIKPYEIIYEFVLRFKRRGTGFEIAKDKLTEKCNFVKLEEKKNKIKEKEKIGKGEIIISCTNGKVNIDLNKPVEVPITEDDIFPIFFRKEKIPPHTLLLETPFFYMPPVGRIFSNISIYDFDPKLPKRATPITGKAELEENGSNLSIVLSNIIRHKDKKRKLFNLINELLPFVDDIDVENFADKSLLFTLRETYSEKQYLPASSISDGTINVTALLVALYFEKVRRKGLILSPLTINPLTIIEEPERNIHPYLISKVVDMMKDASQKKQIIVTTHNPEVVKHVDRKNILLVSRDKEGFSTISRPADEKEIKTFLKNEIGIEELYVQNLLEV